MTERFAPEHLVVINEQTGENNFADAWGLACAQMGVTLTALAAAQPEVSFRREDLVGYHQLQYGLLPDIIDETLELASSDNSTWGNWELGRPLIDLLPKILGDETTPALMERIVLGDGYRAQQARILSPDLTDLLELREEPGPRREEVSSLYPLDGNRLVYNGRVTLDIGKVVMGCIGGELKVYSDSLTVTTDSESRGLLVVSKHGPTSFSYIRELRMF